jgi:hypothetical protein
VRDRIIKPRVFLSHSKHDKTFIHSVSNNLRKCQVESWLDEVDIRTGTPWLESIFQDGIPTCDSMFVYLTDSSIESQMVKKELDVGIIQKLKDKHVALLPYVSYEDLRSKLRPDIQALQVPVFNDDNFHEVFPRLVAEIWRSFTERMIHVAVQDEQNARLKAELEVQRLSKGQDQSVFSPAESTDFKYIYDHFNVPYVGKIKTVKSPEPRTNPNQPDIWGPTFQVTFNLGSLVGNLPTISSVEHERFHLNQYVVYAALKKYSEFKSTQEEKFRHYLGGEIQIQDELLTFGLLQMTYEPATATRASGKWKAIYTDKMFRYRYWLAYNGLLPNALVFEGEISKEDGKAAQPGNGADGG